MKKMKFTNYLINGNVINLNALETDNKYLQPLSIILQIIMSFFGILFISSLIPLAIIIDNYRTIKFNHIKKIRCL